MSAPPASDSGGHLAERVIEHIRRAIEDHGLLPGDQLPPERDLARQLNVSRATVRWAVAYLMAMGVLRIRHGAGTFVADGPPEIGQFSLTMTGVPHSFQPWQMCEARVILESALAGLAAERGREHDFAAMAEQVADMYATCHAPAEYLVHDVLFHRTIARASGNPILAALMETVAAALHETRRRTMENTGNLKESADLHCEIYRAIRTARPDQARDLMEQHLRQAQAALHPEAAGTDRITAGALPPQPAKAAQVRSRRNPLPGKPA